MPDIYEKVYELKMKIRSLENELEDLKPELEEQVFEDMEGKEPVRNRFGEFKFTYYPKWEYTSELQSQEEMVKHKIKVMKKQEEKEGKAVKVSDGGRLVHILPKL